MAAPCKAADHKIYDTVVSQTDRCTEVDVPISYNPKIYNKRQEISCRRVDRLVSVSPSWFVADLTVAEMACRRDDRTPTNDAIGTRQCIVIQPVLSHLRLQLLANKCVVEQASGPDKERLHNVGHVCDV